MYKKSIKNKTSKFSGFLEDSDFVPSDRIGNVTLLRIFSEEGLGFELDHHRLIPLQVYRVHVDIRSLGFPGSVADQPHRPVARQQRRQERSLDVAD